MQKDRNVTEDNKQIPTKTLKMVELNLVTESITTCRR